MVSSLQFGLMLHSSNKSTGLYRLPSPRMERKKSLRGLSLLKGVSKYKIPITLHFSTALNKGGYNGSVEKRWGYFRLKINSFTLRHGKRLFEHVGQYSTAYTDIGLLLHSRDIPDFNVTIRNLPCFM